MSSPAPPAPAPSGGTGQQDRPDRSMSLLVDVMTHTLDEGYAARAATGPRPSSTPGLLAGAVVLVALGLLTGTAVAQVRDRAEASEGLRTQLAAEVDSRRAEADRLADEAAQLRADVASLRDDALAADDEGRRLRERVRALELAAATSAVEGEGVVLEIDDAPLEEDLEAEPRGGTALDGRVLDRDLQDLVNGLWAAGAEAVAVDGLRLSSRSAIRSAGEAVLVDFRPVSPPYVVEAVGKPSELEVRFLDGPSGRRLQTLAAATGISYELRRDEDLELAAATEPQLRATRLPGGTS